MGKRFNDKLKVVSMQVTRYANWKDELRKVRKQGDMRDIRRTEIYLTHAKEELKASATPDFLVELFDLLEKAREGK